ncbi:MAG: glucosaminidase domain-containing protein [Candidatus Bilamarchaeaceae archaeon]
MKKMKYLFILFVIMIIITSIILMNIQKEKEINTGIELAKTITVLRPSFMTLNDVVKACKGTGFQGYETAFLKAEEVSGIGADYLLAIAFHETKYGTNTWWREWNNAFSWGITDSGPNSEAYKIKEMTKEQAIVYTAKKIKELYLTKGGLYYSGETLSAMNVYYARDKNWANAIISIHANIVKNLSEEQRAMQWAMGTKILQGNLPTVQYFTQDYWDKPLTRRELAIILWRVNNK